jgi:hypothetical protein
MKTYTIYDIKNIKPCYCPTKFLSPDWAGTLVDILDVSDCPPQDRIWVVTKLLDDKTNRLFAVWCARKALKLVDNPDPRSIAACDVAERYASGAATDAELRDAAYDAAWAIKSEAAWAAAATYATEAAWAAAATYATEAAWEAAWAAAADVYAAARNAQIKQLKQMITEVSS